jgi:hypothetical protein
MAGVAAERTRPQDGGRLETYYVYSNVTIRTGLVGT